MQRVHPGKNKIILIAVTRKKLLKVFYSLYIEDR